MTTWIIHLAPVGVCFLIAGQILEMEVVVVASFSSSSSSVSSSFIIIGFIIVIIVVVIKLFPKLNTLRGKNSSTQNYQDVAVEFVCFFFLKNIKDTYKYEYQRQIQIQTQISGCCWRICQTRILLLHCSSRPLYPRLPCSSNSLWPDHAISAFQVEFCFMKFLQVEIYMKNIFSRAGSSRTWVTR